MHTYFEVLRGVPARIDMTGAKPKGNADKRAVLESAIESDRCYIVDRGFAKFRRWIAIAGPTATHTKFKVQTSHKTTFKAC